MSWIVILLMSMLPATIIANCIDSFVKLENEILSNSKNIHSLTRAFYPANDHPGLWLEVRYYINSTDDTESSTMSFSPILPEDDEVDYVFYWSFSPVLLIANPEFLEGVSFRFITFPLLVANIHLSPFCSNLNESSILSLLNDITIWLKSYAVKRSSSTTIGIDPTLQGYSLYKPNISIDLIIPLGIDVDNYVNMMTAAVFLLVFLCQVVACTALCKSHDKLCEKLNEDTRNNSIADTNSDTSSSSSPANEPRKKSGNHFIMVTLNNIFWSTVICLLLGEFVAIGFGIEHMCRYGFQRPRHRRIIYIMAFIMLLMFSACDFVIAIHFAMNIQKKKIEPPKCLKWLKIVRTPWCIFSISQFFAILSFLFLSMIFPIFIYGVTFAVLIHPLRVSLMAVVTLIFIITFTLVVAYIFEHCDKSIENINSPQGNQQNVTTATESWYNRMSQLSNVIAECQRKKEKIKVILQTILFVILLFMQCTFIGLFSAVYLNAILFTGPDKSGVLHQLAQLFPAALFIWVLKKEYNWHTQRQ